MNSYILKPEQIRAGENTIEPITSYGGVYSNVIVNTDGTGTLLYNNSDYTVSLSNDLIKGATSNFVISNVGSSDTVQFYEDNSLVSTTTGNTVPYTPSTAGSHSVYFKVNGTSTGTIPVTVYTISSIQTTLDITQTNYINIGSWGVTSFQVTVKPNISDATGVLSNVPITITYNGTSTTYSVSSQGSTVNIPFKYVSVTSTPSLIVSCSNLSYNYTMKEYVAGYKNAPQYNTLDDLGRFWNAATKYVSRSIDSNLYLRLDNSRSSIQRAFRAVVIPNNESKDTLLKFTAGNSTTLTLREYNNPTNTQEIPITSGDTVSVERVPNLQPGDDSYRVIVTFMDGRMYSMTLSNGVYDVLLAGNDHLLLNDLFYGVL